MSTKYDENTKLWSNLNDQPLSELRKTKGQWIWDYLLMHGPKIAQINDDNGQQMTFNEIRLKAIRAAQNLLKRGFKPRQKFCFMIDNNDDLIALILASFGLACPIVPLCPILSKAEITRILAKIKPPIIFSDTKLYDLLKEVLDELRLDIKVFTFEQHTSDVESIESLFKETGEEGSFTPIEHDLENDVAAIFCSSGTTGPSKCASIAYGYSEFLPRKYDADSVFFSFDTIYWSVSLNPIVDSIYNGTVRIITLKPPSPELQLTIIEKYRVTDISNLPLTTAACIKSDLIHTANLSSVRCIIFYGGKLPQSLIVDTEKYFPNAELLSFYGLTELGAVSSLTLSLFGNRCSPNVMTLTSIDSRNTANGTQLFYGCIIKIVDDNGNRCGANVNGEICVKKEHNFLGYYDDSIATAAAIDSEGFFQTGDIGHFDDDGNLFIEDRKKNAMNVFYFDNVLLPSKIEEHLVTVAGVREVCVVGVQIACSFYLPAAVIVRDPNSNLDRRTVFDAVADNFPNGLKLRGGIYFVDEIPKTPTGKFSRKMVTELAEERFKVAKENDPEVMQHLLDISDEYKKMI